MGIMIVLAILIHKVPEAIGFGTFLKHKNPAELSHSKKQNPAKLSHSKKTESRGAVTFQICETNPKTNLKNTHENTLENTTKKQRTIGRTFKRTFDVTFVFCP